MNTILFVVEQLNYLNDNNSVVVEGKLTGDLITGTKLYLENLDYEDIYEVVISNIEVNDTNNEVVKLTIDNVKELPIKTGTVLSNVKEEYNAKRLAIKEAIHRYCLEERLVDISIEELSTYDLHTLTTLYVDCNDILNKINDEKETIRKKLALTQVILDKIRLCEIFYFFSNYKTTFPQYDISVEKLRDGRVIATDPCITILTRGEVIGREDSYTTSEYKLENGEVALKGLVDKNLLGFLNVQITNNGVAGFRVNSDHVYVTLEVFCGLQKIDRHIEENHLFAHPHLCKWILLNAQIKGIEENYALELQTFHNFISLNIFDAKFAVPVLSDEADKRDGFVNKEELGILKMDCMHNNATGRPITFLFTDFEKFYNKYPTDYAPALFTLEELIDKFDCVINHTPDADTDLMITMDVYKKYKQLNRIYRPRTSIFKKLFNKK